MQVRLTALAMAAAVSVGESRMAGCVCASVPGGCCKVGKVGGTAEVWLNKVVRPAESKNIRCR